MTHSSHSTTNTEQLVALNDELLAFVRAGIPLDQGLQLYSRDLSGQLRRITEQLGKELEQGQTLENALRRQPTTFPAAYRALVITGIKSQRLPDVLEQIARSLKRLAQIQATIRRSFVYPLVTLAFVYAFFLASITSATPQIVASYRELIHHDEPLLDNLTTLSDTVIWWWPLPPLIVLGVTAIATRRSRFLPGHHRLAHAWTPWRRLEQLGHISIFGEVLALLVAHNEPLPSALVLAGEATGSESILRDSQRLAEQLSRGERLAASPTTETVLERYSWPPLLTWLLLSSHDASGLAESLHRFARGHQRQADRLALTLSFVYPVILGTLVAGAGVLAYAIWVTFPWYLLLYRLGQHY